MPRLRCPEYYLLPSPPYNPRDVSQWKHLAQLREMCNEVVRKTALVPQGPDTLGFKLLIACPRLG